MPLSWNIRRESSWRSYNSLFDSVCSDIFGIFRWLNFYNFIFFESTVPVDQQTNRSRHSWSRPPGSRPGESRPVDDGEHAWRDYAATGGGSGISAQRQNPKQVPQGGELIPTQRRQISTSSSSSSSSSATQQVRQNSSSSSTSSSRFVTPGEGRSATHPLSGTGRPSRHEEIMCHQNFGYVGISEDKRRLAESENQIKYQLSEYGRRTGFDTSIVEDLMLRTIKKQQLNGWCRKRVRYTKEIKYFQCTPPSFRKCLRCKYACRAVSTLSQVACWRTQIAPEWPPRRKVFGR